MKKQIANIVSSCRILLSITLLFCPVFSVGFYCTYILCGFTDMVDGTIARKTNSVSEFGARLDSIADVVFVAVCFVQIMPILHIPAWLFVWIVMIAIIKIGNAVLWFVLSKRFVSIHTVLNKVTGFLLFLFPFTLGFIEPLYSSVAVCVLAMVSAIYEVYYFIDRENKLCYDKYKR